MTYERIADWMTLDNLLGLARGDRIAYIRKNLTTGAKDRDGELKPLTLDQFAAAVGATGRHRPIAWEKGRVPRDYRKRIAALTPYPADAFGGDDEAELLRQRFGDRLEALEEGGRDRLASGILLASLGLVLVDELTRLGGRVPAEMREELVQAVTRMRAEGR